MTAAVVLVAAAGYAATLTVSPTSATAASIRRSLRESPTRSHLVLLANNVARPRYKGNATLAVHRNAIKR